MKKIYIVIAVVLIFLFATGTYAYNVNKDLSEKIIRLHILANSNNVYDQKIKYEIRNKLLESYSFKGENIREVYSEIKNNIPQIQKDVDKWLKEFGVSYNCKVTLQKDSFPRKSYGNIKLPQGEYMALKIILGNGDGQNWWCVMFPPLCFTENSTGMISKEGDAYLRANLSKEGYRLMTDENVEIRFKVVEIFNKIF
jgi:stage II sporulation protein R